MPTKVVIYARIVGFLADKMRLIVQTYQKKTYQIVEIGEIVGLSGNFESSPNLCVNSSFSYVVLSTLLLFSRDLTEWSLVYHSTLSYQRFYDLHSIHYDHLEGLHQLI